jgi:Ca2+/Na+ antiporter
LATDVSVTVPRPGRCSRYAPRVAAVLLVLFVVAFVAWVVMLFRAGRRNERWEEESGHAEARQPELPAHSVVTQGIVYLAFAVLTAVSLPFWLSDGETTWERRSNARGSLMIASFLIIGVVAVAVGLRRRKQPREHVLP